MLVGETGHSGLWGSGAPCTPLGTNSVRASTPHYTDYKTGPPIKALTPTLQESVHWKSTASERSLSLIGRGISTVSEVTEDDVFTPGEGNIENPVPRGGSSSHSQALRDVSNIINREERHGEQRKERNADSTSSNDDDTPHLYRSKQTLQQSYAAQHLRSMREGSTEPETKTEKARGKFEKDFLRDVSVSSIETQRHRDFSMTDSSIFPSMSFSIDESPPNTSSSSLKKRPFSSVERSPLHEPTVHTNLTMEFDGFAIGDEHRRKRIIRNIETRVKEKSHHKIHRLRSFNSRLSKSKSKSRLSRKSSKSRSIGSSVTSPIESTSTVDSLVYLGSVSSMGSYCDSSPFPVLGIDKKCFLTGAQPPTLPANIPNPTSPMVTSSPTRRCTLHPPGHPGGEEKADFNVNKQANRDFYTGNENSDCKETFPKTDLIIPSGLVDRECSISMDVSPSSEMRTKSSLNTADAKLLLSSSGSDIIAEPMPKTPDTRLNPDVNTLNNPFKTPSPVSRSSGLTSPTQFSISSHGTGYDLESSLSMGEDYGLQRLFVNNTDMSDTSGNDLDSSFHELSIGSSNMRRASMSQPCSEDFEMTKMGSPNSAISTPTTATITPNTSKLDPSMFEKLETGKVETGRVKNKLLKKVTTFMSLPASSGASEGDDSDALGTPAMRGQVRRRHFMVGHSLWSFSSIIAIDFFKPHLSNMYNGY